MLACLKFGQAIRHLGRLQCPDRLFKVACNHLVQVVKRHVHAMIGETVLGKVVGSDFLFATSGTNQVLSVRRLLFVLLTNLCLEQLGSQNLESFFLVLSLASPVLALHLDAGRQVCHLNC